LGITTEYRINSTSGSPGTTTLLHDHDVVALSVQLCGHLASADRMRTLIGSAQGSVIMRSGGRRHRERAIAWLSHARHSALMYTPLMDRGCPSSTSTLRKSFVWLSGSAQRGRCSTAEPPPTSSYAPDGDASDQQ